MLISHKHRFVFIHIYKTAGTSVRQLFVPHARLRDRLAYEFRLSRSLYGNMIRLMHWEDDGMRQFTGIHKHAGANEAREYLGRRRFDAYFKFAFVRDPHDLLVSLYFYIRQARTHRDHVLVSGQEFPEFVDWHLSTRPPRQCDFLTEPETGELLVDFVGKLENIDADTAQVYRKILGHAPPGIGHANRSLERDPALKHEYFDADSARRASAYFARDFELFGYADMR